MVPTSMALTCSGGAVRSNSLSVPRGGNAFHTAKQRHQVRNLNAFERMHGILDLPAQPFVDATCARP